MSVCGFGLAWFGFFFVWMGKDFVLELICVRVSFPSVARHMTAACIRSSISNVLGFFGRGGIHVGLEPRSSLLPVERSGVRKWFGGFLWCHL